MHWQSYYYTLILKLFIHISLLFFTFNNLKTQPFVPQHVEDTARFRELKDYVGKNYFSKTPNVELYADQAIALAKKLKDYPALAELYREMGIIQYFNGDYDKALYYYLESVRLFQSQKNISGEAAAYNEIANVYRKHKRLDEALEILNKAYSLSASIHDTSGMAKALNNSGIVHEVRNELGTAVTKYQQALSFYNVINDSVGLSYSYENIGGIHLMKNEFSEAETNLLKSLKIRQDQHLEQGTAMSYHYLGELYQKKGDLIKSNAMFEDCIALGRKINYPDIVQRGYFSLANNYKLSKNYPKAYESFEKATQIKDSLFNVEKSRQLTEMQTKYELEKKIKENQLLKQNNELVSQQVRNKNLILFIILFIFVSMGLIVFVLYKKRQNSLATQTQLKIQRAEQQQRIRISHDLHDHVGAQLSYVVSNLDIAGQEIRSRQLDPKRLDSITEMSKQAISTLRETVWALNNESISVESFADKFKAYAQKMTDLSENIRVEFHENISMDNILLPNTALHLFRVCQESFSNALKHSGCTVISIDITSSPDELFIFRLSDNGIGFDPEEARQKGHYGLENMRHRAAEVGATYTITTQKGQGTKIDLTIEKNNAYA
jgi:signal transduction histidine kinase